MKVGSLVYATAQGLGYLAKSFYDHGIVTDVMVIHHGKHPEQPWYPGSPRITDLRDARQQARMREFCASMDVMLFFETPFDWSLLQHCKKSVLMPMYECTPEKIPVFPDYLLCPSRLDLEVFQKRYPAWYMSGHIHYLPVPAEYPWKLRTKAEIFVHNAGHGGLKGRNGTAELLQALQYVTSPARVIIRAQEFPREMFTMIPPVRGAKVEWVIDTIPYDQLFSQGDVFVFPEKFNGLSLPLQEARAAGMLVMCGDRFPMNDWLPTKVRLNLEDQPMCFPDEHCWTHDDDDKYANPLIPVANYVTNRIGPPYLPFEQAQFDPKAIAVKIDEWYGRDITAYSESGREWAKTMSWEVLGLRYREVLEKVVCG